MGGQTQRTKRALSGKLSQEYARLREMVTAARALRIWNADSRGTAFIMDGTANSTRKFKYQQVGRDDDK